MESVPNRNHPGLGVLLVSQHMVGGGKNTTSKWLATAVAQPRWPVGKSGCYRFPCASHSRTFRNFLGAIKRHMGQYSARSKSPLVMLCGQTTWVGMCRTQALPGKDKEQCVTQS